MTDRQTKILEIVNQKKKVEVATLSKMLEVSQVTIRKDLDALEEHKFLTRENGYETISQNGSHMKMKNVHTGKSVIVPYHSKDLKKGLEQAILKQAGIR